jgi:phosphatidylinositol-3,4,5-trisphosphate 5-phosphatase 1
VNNRKLKLIWKGREQKPEKFLFLSPEERERFVESSWALRVNSNPQLRIEKVSIWVGTWNMGNAPPPEGTQSWLPERGKHDLIAIGVQECEYSPRKNLQNCEADWFGVVTSMHLLSFFFLVLVIVFVLFLVFPPSSSLFLLSLGHFGEEYYKVAALSLLSMRIIILAKKEHKYHITRVTKASKPTGIGGVIGNKGAVGVSFLLGDTKLCFVNSHMAAHAEKVDHRNNEWRDIIRGLGSLVGLLPSFSSSLSLPPFLLTLPPALLLPYTFSPLILFSDNG